MLEAIRIELVPFKPTRLISMANPDRFIPAHFMGMVDPGVTSLEAIFSLDVNRTILGPISF